MKRLFLTLFLAAFAAAVLLAADFWTTKEFAEWNDKEVKKILTNSPWAKTQDITMGARLPAGGGGRRGGGGGGGGGGAPGGRGGGGGQGGGGQNLSMPSMRVYLRWVSALPVRQAIVRQRYGNEINSPEAQKYLDVQDDRHVLVVAGMPVNMAGSRSGGGRGGRGGGEPGQRPDPAELQKRVTANLMAGATLRIKGKEPVHPSQVQVGGTQEEPQIYLVFPAAKDGGVDIVLEDKDVEFQMKLRSGNTLRRKFKLRDMVYNGKLEI